MMSGIRFSSSAIRWSNMALIDSHVGFSTAAVRSALIRAMFEAVAIRPAGGDPGAPPGAERHPYERRLLDAERVEQAGDVADVDRDLVVVVGPVGKPVAYHVDRYAVELLAQRPDGGRVPLPVAAGAVQQDHGRGVLAARLGDPRGHPVHVDPPLAELNLAQPRHQDAVLGPGVVQGGVTLPMENFVSKR